MAITEFMGRGLTLMRTIWRNQHRQMDVPRLLTYIVTFTCNARCIMCDSWKKPSPDDLTLAEIDTIFAQLPPMDAVRLTGGEPFVRRDLLDIAHLVQRRLKPLTLHVTTNGFLTDRIVAFCEQRDKTIPLYVLVSVDGMQDKHNTVRGKSDAWERVVATLQTLAPQQKAWRLRLAVNQTIVDAEGVEHYRQLRDFLQPLGIRNHVVMAYDVSATYSVQPEIDLAPAHIGEFVTFGSFSSEQIAELLDEVEADVQQAPFLERLAKRYYLQGIRRRLLDHTGVPNPPCVALNSHLRLLPDGSVPTCQFNSKTVGSLRHQRFQDVWHGQQALQQRQWVHRCPGCWAECEVLPNAMYTGDLIRQFWASLPPTRTAPPPSRG